MSPKFLLFRVSVQGCNCIGIKNCRCYMCVQGLVKI